LRETFVISPVGMGRGGAAAMKVSDSKNIEIPESELYLRYYELNFGLSY